METSGARTRKQSTNQLWRPLTHKRIINTLHNKPGSVTPLPLDSKEVIDPTSCYLMSLASTLSPVHLCARPLTSNTKKSNRQKVSSVLVLFYWALIYVVPCAVFPPAELPVRLVAFHRHMSPWIALPFNVTSGDTHTHTTGEEKSLYGQCVLIISSTTTRITFSLSSESLLVLTVSPSEPSRFLRFNLSSTIRSLMSLLPLSLGLWQWCEKSIMW